MENSMILILSFGGAIFGAAFAVCVIKYRERKLNAKIAESVEQARQQRTTMIEKRRAARKAFAEQYRAAGNQQKNGVQ